MKALSFELFLCVAVFIDLQRGLFSLSSSFFFSFLLISPFPRFHLSHSYRFTSIFLISFLLVLIYLIRHSFTEIEDERGEVCDEMAVEMLDVSIFNSLVFGGNLIDFLYKSVLFFFFFCSVFHYF